MILPLAVFAQLAAHCGPAVHVDTLASIARAESGFQTYAIHDNTDGRRYLPRSLEEAIAIATDLVTAKRHSVDLGLMQINSANLAPLGLTVGDAFDPCKNLSAAARILATAYDRPAAGDDAQPALRQALSRYNTGDPLRGVSNGYVARVQAAAEEVVPALRLSSRAGRALEEIDPVAPDAPPPSWDVFARARFARERARAAAGAGAGRAPAHGPLLATLPGSPQPVQLQVSPTREVPHAP